MENNNKPTEFIHNRLKYYRNINGLTQRQVANTLGVNRSTYTYYETGRSIPSLDILSTLCTIYRITISDLLNAETLPNYVSSPSIKLFPESKSETTTEEPNADDPIKFSSLTRDEQNLILKYRLYSKKQKEELLNSLGIDYKKSKKHD